MAEEEVEEKIMKAGLNQVFICLSCAHAFLDRDATQPVAIDMKNAVAQEGKMEPHAKYPDDAELAKLVYENTHGHRVKIDAREAQECCKQHIVLCDSRHLRFRKEADGTYHIVGAEHLE